MFNLIYITILISGLARIESFTQRSLDVLPPCLNICPLFKNSGDNSNCTDVSVIECLTGDDRPNHKFTTPNDLSMVENETSLTLSWKASHCYLCDTMPTYSPVYRVEIRKVQQLTSNDWIRFPFLTCENSWSMSWSAENKCTALQFRVVALGQCLEKVSNYSEIAPSPGLRPPPSLSEVSVYKSRNQNVDEDKGFFELKISWKLLWTEFSELTYEYSRLVAIHWYCPKYPGSYIGYPVSLIRIRETIDKSIGWGTLKIHTSNIGCRLTYLLEAVTECNIKSSVDFKLDLLDCQLVPDEFANECFLPVDPSSMILYYPKLTEKSEFSGDNLFCLTWEAPLNDTIPVGYQIAWRTTPSEEEKLLIHYLNVTGNLSASIIDCPSCSMAENVSFQIMAFLKTSPDSLSHSEIWQCFELTFDNAAVEEQTDIQIPNPIDSCFSQYDGQMPPNIKFVIAPKCTEPKVPGPHESTTTPLPTTSAFSTFSTSTPSSPTDVPLIQRIEIWLPVLFLVVICIGGIALLSVCIFKYRSAEKSLTVDKLRQVLSDVSTPSNVLRHGSKLIESSSTNSSNPILPLSQTSSLSSGDNWEIVSSKLTFTQLIGEGAFGKVMKAKMMKLNEEIVVAVKMIPENASPMLLEDFLNEIEITKKMGRHPNLVNMLACITLSQPVCLVVEHAENGDLLSFLQKQKNILNPDNLTLRDLSYIDLLTFAKQVALGMEFISVRGFIHRDLACRNILVDDQRNVKIGDFGLARYVYDNSIYMTRIGRALPIRWCAPEALYERKFTIASDVWSYGIFLYELVTLGAPPYPGVETRKLFKDLRNGFVMEKPSTKNCPPSLYKVMRKCWTLNPHDRPSFTDLARECDKLLAEWTSTDYVDVTQTTLSVYEVETCHGVYDAICDAEGEHFSVDMALDSSDDDEEGNPP